MQHSARASVLYCSTALLLGLTTLVAAHGDDGSSHESMDMGSMSMEDVANSIAKAAASHPVAPSYFHNSEHQGWLYAHILSMVLAWVIVLPIGIMLSIARSRLTIATQLAFLAINTLGVGTSVVYNASTLDLYPNNAHHKIGWVATWIATGWFAMAVPVMLRSRKSNNDNAAALRPAMTAQNMAHYDRLQNDDDSGVVAASGEERNPRDMYRWSRDSHGSDGSGTLRNSSSDSLPHQHKLEPQSPIDEDAADALLNHEDAAEHSDFLHDDENRVNRLINLKLARFSPSGKLFSVIKVLYIILERTILLLAFVALLTGGITWGNLFRDRLAFSGAAHFVKGGIFFWYGLLTLGRWMGAFSDYGWAWNIKPNNSMISRFARRLPSAEFTESFVIWLYGASNVFLEHLNAWGEKWSFEDFEHISITVMFFGGGLLGMLVESETFKSLFNASVTIAQEDCKIELGEEQREGFAEPNTYRHSLNPMPALVILLLGRMMGGHQQESMVSTMMHAQWGNLFVGFALARAATYVMLYISPPTSFFPSRPPTELVAAFCLISGGMIFMGSATDTVSTIEKNGLDAMFLFTVAMGFSALIMAWAAMTFAIKGWAMKREAKRRM